MNLSLFEPDRNKSILRGPQKRLIRPRPLQKKQRVHPKEKKYEKE